MFRAGVLPGLFLSVCLSVSGGGSALAMPEVPPATGNHLLQPEFEACNAQVIKYIENNYRPEDFLRKSDMVMLREVDEIRIGFLNAERNGDWQAAEQALKSLQRVIKFLMPKDLEPSERHKPVPAPF